MTRWKRQPTHRSVVPAFGEGRITCGPYLLDAKELYAVRRALEGLARKQLVVPLGKMLARGRGAHRWHVGLYAIHSG